MAKNKFRATSTASAYAVYNILPLPVMSIILAFLMGYGDFNYMGGFYDAVLNSAITSVLTIGLFILLAIRNVRESRAFPYIVLAVAFLEAMSVSVLWSLLALPLFLLPTILSGYYQRKGFVRFNAVLSLIFMALAAVISYFLGMGTFSSAAANTDVSNARTLLSLYAVVIPAAVIIGTLCIAVVSVAKYNISANNYQRNLANTIAVDDQLNVYNKSQFQIKLKSTLSAPSPGSYCLVVTDIVKFRLYNDLFGHGAGDKLLKNITEIMRDFVGDDGMIGRLSDDHIVCLVDRMKFEPEAIATMLFHNKSLSGTNDYIVDVICGIYEITDRRTATEIMFDCALTAVHSEKAHKDGYAFYRDAMMHEEHRNKEFFKELTVALEQNQFVPYFQPQCTDEGKIVGAEVLSRWNHPERGMLAPGAFVPLCEENGLISTLDKNMWIKACETLENWAKKGIEGCPLSVNISPVDIYEMDIFSVISEIADSHHVPHDKLHLEITESTIMKDPEKMFDTVNRLRKAGFVVMIDDFGSGYSSLGMLSDVEIDFIKLDISFMKRLESNDKSEKAKKVLSNISALAKNLNINTIVEGVETEQHIVALREIGYDCYQGYYFSRPIDTEEFENRYLA